MPTTSERWGHFTVILGTSKPFAVVPRTDEQFNVALRTNEQFTVVLRTIPVVLRTKPRIKSLI